MATLKEIIKDIDELVNKMNLDDAIRLISYNIDSAQSHSSYDLHLQLFNIYSITKNDDIYYDFHTKYFKLNAKLIFELARLNHYHFDEYDIAKEMYTKCITREPCKTRYRFELAKLLYDKFRDFKTAKSHLEICLQIDDTKACVWYYLALVMCRMYCNESNISYAFLKAITITPNVIKYYLEFASYSQSISKYHLSQYLYKICLKLSNNSISYIHAQYARFLKFTLRNDMDALKHIKKAAELSQLFIDEYHEYASSVRESSESCKIELVIYNSKVIYHKYKLSFNDQMNSQKLNESFGGIDRIESIQNHFKKILSLYNVNIIILLNDEEYQTMYKLFTRLGFLYHVKLIQYKGLTFTEKQISDIINIKDDYGLSYFNETLYITNEDDIHTFTDNLQENVKVYFVNDEISKPLIGLKLFDFRAIEQLLFDSHNNITDTQSNINSYDINKVLSEIDNTLRINMNKEIKRKYKRPQTLFTRQYALEQMDINSDFSIFVKYADNLINAFCAADDFNWWIAYQYLHEASYLDNDNPDIIQKKAKALSYLQYNNEAIENYNIALRLKPTDVTCRLSFGWHYIKSDKPREALYQLEYAYKLSKRKDNRLLTALGRASELVGRMDYAEYYYTNAIKISKNERSYHLSHQFYGNYLRSKGEFEKAYIQLSLSIKLKPHRFNNNYSFSALLYQQEKFKESKYFLLKSLSIDINASCAKLEFMQKFGNEYKNLAMSKFDASKQIKFDNFWFDELKQLNPTFNMYYDEMVENGLNDIDALMNEAFLPVILQLMIKGMTSKNAHLIDTKMIQFVNK